MFQSVLRPNDLLRKAVAAQMEELPATRLALHMRYGDSCGDDAQRTARRCEPVATFQAAAADMIRRYGYKSVLLVSDSKAALAHFSSNFSVEGVAVRASNALTVGDQLYRDPRARFESFGRVDGLSRVDEWRLFWDFLVYLHSLASCDGLVGKFTSNVDRITLALMAMKHRCIPPYISLDRSAWCFLQEGSSMHGSFVC